MDLPIFVTHLGSRFARRIQDPEVFQKSFVLYQSGFFPIVLLLNFHGFDRTRGNSWFTMAVEKKLVALVTGEKGCSQACLAQPIAHYRYAIWNEMILGQIMIRIVAHEA